MVVRDRTCGKQRGWKAEITPRKEYGSDEIENEKELPFCWTSQLPFYQMGPSFSLKVKTDTSVIARNKAADNKDKISTKTTYCECM